MKPTKLADAIISRIYAVPDLPAFVSTASDEILGNPVQPFTADELNVAQTFLMKEMVDHFCDLYPSAGRSLPVCTRLSSNREPLLMTLLYLSSGTEEKSFTPGHYAFPRHEDFGH